MIETPRIVETNPQPVAFLHLMVPASEIQKVMIPGLNEVKAAMAAQGVAYDEGGEDRVSRRLLGPWRRMG